VKIARLTSCKNFVGKRKKFIFNAYVDLKPMERFENGSDMCGSLNNSARKRVLDLLEPVKLTVRKVVLERITVIKVRMDNGSCNGAGCFEFMVWADTAEFMDMIVTRFRKCRDKHNSQTVKTANADIYLKKLTAVNISEL